MSSRRLDRLSDLYFAMGESIIARDLGISVGNYNEFTGEALEDATVLIEIEGTRRGTRSNEGRSGRLVRVTLHAVVAKWRENANLEAVNLADVLQDIVEENRWGLPGRQCDIPKEITTGPSMYSEGKNGYEAWCCSFQQMVYLGDVLFEDPAVVGMPMVARSWEVPSVDDPASYQKLEGA